jgi:predicted Kef-type K+ transport protein
MDFFWIFISFIAGFAVKQIGLPPLVGYLGAGFALNASGVAVLDSLETFANLGITLLLFTIGLKINFKDLTEKEVWSGASIHMVLFSAALALIVLAGSVTGARLLNIEWQTALLIGFALCFSSTVCVVKTLEDQGELKIRHGKLAVGALIIQDIAAVLFLVIALGKIPSIWALGLVLLFPARHLFSRLLNASGHGELLPLLGLFFAFGSYELFTFVDLKGDLGALVIGMLLASDKKATELYKSLAQFKDLFLVGFFLAIGFTALPTLETLSLSLILCVLLPIKFFLFFIIYNRFNLRARTGFLTSMVLTNYSEFGLIVASLSVKLGWLAEEWLITIAVAVAISFIISSFAYKHAHSLYAQYQPLINYFQPTEPVRGISTNTPIQPHALIVGLGRVGTSSYDKLFGKFGKKLWGIEADSERMSNHVAANRQVSLADAEDIEFWQSLDMSQLQLVMLAVPSMNDMLVMIKQIRRCNYQGPIAAIAQYQDERDQLIKAGADMAFNYYAEVGTGFADESISLLAKS